MASTNHTTHLKLNQWEPGDPVIRTDFNADNQRLEETVALVKLGSATLSGTETGFDVDLSGLDLPAYGELILTLYPIADAIISTNLVIVGMNNLTSGCIFRTGSPDDDTSGTTIATDTIGASSITLLDFVGTTESRVLSLHLMLTAGRLHGYYEDHGMRGPASNSLNRRAFTAFDVNPTYVNLSNLTSIQFKSRAASPILAAGSRYTLYGLRR